MAGQQTVSGATVVNATGQLSTGQLNTRREFQIGDQIGGDPIHHAARVLIEHDRKSAVRPYVPLTDEQWKRCVDRGEVADAITKATLVIGLGSTTATKPPIDLASMIGALKIDENNYRNGNYNNVTKAETADFIKSIHEWLTRMFNL